MAQERSEPVRVDARADRSPLRCPYCHEDVVHEQPGLVACGGCLARHHGACWEETAACASCGGSRRLADGERPPSDAEVAALIARGDRGAALVAPQRRGLDARAAAVAIDVAGAASVAGVERDWGRPVEVAAWSAQGLFLAAGACLALVGGAEPGALLATLGLVIGVAGLVLASILGPSLRRRLARLGLALLDGSSWLLGVAVVLATDAPSQRPSFGLFLLGMLLAAASGALAARALGRGVARAADAAKGS